MEGKQFRIKKLNGKEKAKLLKLKEINARVVLT